MPNRDKAEDTNASGMGAIKLARLKGKHFNIRMYIIKNVIENTNN
jgi:hypothetical protein